MYFTEKKLKVIVDEELQNVLSETKGPFLKAKVIKTILKKIRTKLNVPFYTSDAFNGVRNILRKAVPAKSSTQDSLRISEAPENEYVVSLFDLNKAILNSRIVKDGEITPEKISQKDAWDVARLFSSWLEKQKGANITVEKTRSLLDTEEAPTEDPSPEEVPTEETPTEETPTEEPEEDKDVEPLSRDAIARFFQKLITVHYKSDRAPTESEEGWSAEEPINYIRKESPLMVKMFAKAEYLEQKKFLKEYENWFEQLRTFHKQRGKETLPEELTEKVEELLEGLKQLLLAAHKKEQMRLVKQVKFKDVTKDKIARAAVVNP